MARIRTIKPDFWTDEMLAECTIPARLLFIGTWNFADDKGNFQYSPKKIKMQVFPADNFDVQPLLDELIAHGLLREYVSNNVKYLHIKGFAKHQVINRPSHSKVPEPLITEVDDGIHGALLEGREGKRIKATAFPPLPPKSDLSPNADTSPEPAAEPENPTPQAEPPAAEAKPAEKKFNPRTVELPQCVHPADWQAWCKHRSEIGKPLKPSGVKRQLETLIEFQRVGISCRAVISHSISGGYMGLFAPKNQGRIAAPVSHSQRAASAIEQADEFERQRLKEIE